MKLCEIFTLCCRDEEAATSEPKPLFQVIQCLINRLPNGQQIMEEVMHPLNIKTFLKNLYIGKWPKK